MLGHTSSEFWTRPAATNLEELKQMVVELFGEDAPAFLQLCEADSGQIEHALQQASVRMIQHAILLAIRANSGHPSETPLYYYNFDAEIPGWDQPGTFHSVDLWFSSKHLPNAGGLSQASIMIWLARCVITYPTLLLQVTQTVRTPPES